MIRTLPLAFVFSVLALAWSGTGFVQAQDANAVTVTGGTNYFESKSVIENTDHPENFQAELGGEDMVVTIPGLPQGSLTLELDLAELAGRNPNGRVMAITANGDIVDPRLDICQAAGGPNKAITKTYTISHNDAGDLRIEFVAIQDLAKFSVIRIKDAQGSVLTTILARDHRETDKSKERNFRLLSDKELVFFNIDHAPVGAYSTLSYGADGPRCGLGLSSGNIPDTDGVIIGLEDSQGLKMLPFTRIPLVARQGSAFPPESVQRELRACTDNWTAPGLSWVHYSPSWYMADIEHASDAEKKRFCLPATWIEFTVDNSAGTEAKIFYFGLPVPVKRTDFSDRKYQGFTTTATGSDAAAKSSGIFAVIAGSCDVLSGPDLKASSLGNMTEGFAFRLNVPAGTKKSLMVVSAFYRDDLVSSIPADKATPGSKADPLRFYYASLFKSADEVVDAAATGFVAAKARCEQLDTVLSSSGQNSFRQFLAAESLQSYRANTVLYIDGEGKPLWEVGEGDYKDNNTFDLTIDHVFYELAMHPWTVRNELDTYDRYYNHTDPLVNPDSGETSPDGFSYDHDMGGGLGFSAPHDLSGYEGGRHQFMGQEELQNWIICAGLYWKSTGDLDWLKSHTDTLKTCLNSMLLRDDLDPSKRDGITTFINTRPGFTPEITTYDSLDPALQQSRDNGYIAGKSWAAYLALEAMFTALGDTASAATVHDQAGRTAKSIVGHWDDQGKYIPAIFDGKNTSRISPMVEGLVYPSAMGLDNAVSMTGPYADLIKVLQQHLDSVLAPNVCLDSQIGSWKLSSTSTNTWESKVYLSQYVAEKILGMSDPRVVGPVDQIHASMEVIGSSTQGWSDQLDSYNGHAIGSLHYPRGVTSSLWWLNKEKASASQSTAQ
jgi:hypothetical protein